MVNHQKNLFEGVDEMLQRLSEKYTLFISSRSDDSFLQAFCKSLGISEYFEVIMGSSVLEKGRKHIETFELYSGDTQFEQKTVVIGDGNIDRELAEESFLPFIKIGKEGKDRYEIDSVLEIEEYIKKVR